MVCRFEPMKNRLKSAFAMKKRRRDARLDDKSERAERLSQVGARVWVASGGGWCSRAKRRTGRISKTTARCLVVSIRSRIETISSTPPGAPGCHPYNPSGCILGDVKNLKAWGVV